ncbi:MAG: OmpH family outer membrane protein [Syntrophotaleaceae bacterium]
MRKVLGSIVALLLLVAAPVSAAELKIGYIDLQKALNLSEAGKVAKSQIAEKVKKFQGTIESRQNELKKLNQEMEKQKMVLSAEAKAEKERDYQQKIKDYQRFAKDAQEELQQEDAQATRSILEDLFKVVKDIGNKGKYTMILEKTESSVLYADDAINLTDEVIAAYNKVYKKGK